MPVQHNYMIINPHTILNLDTNSSHYFCFDDDHVLQHGRRFLIVTEDIEMEAENKFPLKKNSSLLHEK